MTVVKIQDASIRVVVGGVPGIGLKGDPGEPVDQLGTRAEVSGLNVPAPLTAIRTTGYAVTGDGGSALYKRTGSEPPHAGKVQSADGAWWEIAERVIDVRMLGAVGDGATDNASALQNAINVGVALGAPVFVPSGVFVTGPLAMPSGLTLQGESMWLSVLRLRQNNSFGGPTDKNAVLTNANVIPADFGGSGARDRDITVRDLCLDGNRANQSGTSTEAECLSFYGAEDCYVENLRLINAVADGYDLDYCDRIGARNLIIDNCGKAGVHFSLGNPQGINIANDDCWLERATITNCGASGLTDVDSGGKGNRNRFRDITIKDCSDEGISGGKDFRGAFSVLTAGSTVHNIRVEDTTSSGLASGSGMGILLGGPGIIASDLVSINSAGTGVFLTADATNIVVNGVIVGVTGSHGFRCDANDAQVSNVSVDGAVTNGIYLYGTGNFRGTNLVSVGAGTRGCTIEDGGGSQILGLSCRDSQTHGLLILNHNGFQILGGKQIGNNLSNGATVNGITVQGSSSGSITGVYIRQGSGFQRYGISILSGSDNNIVTNNDLRSSGSTGELSDAGAGTITTAGNVT